MATNSTSVKLTIKITSFVLRLLLNIFFYIVVIILTINVSKMAFGFTYQLFGPVTMDEAPGTDINFAINEGDSSMDVATKLEVGALITNKYAFYLKGKLQKSVIMPGTYALNTSMTYNEIFTVITDYSASFESQAGIKNESSETDTGTDTTSDTNAK